MGAGRLRVAGVTVDLAVEHVDLMDRGDELFVRVAVLGLEKLPKAGAGQLEAVDAPSRLHPDFFGGAADVDDRRPAWSKHESQHIGILRAKTKDRRRL